jgi:hypothetical protein
MLTYIRHHLFILVLQDRLYLAPIPQPRHVLDIGTGIGLWAKYIQPPKLLHPLPKRT